MCELLLKNLNNKSVFIFDTETTGLPERVPHTTWGTPGEYWLYSMNDKYDKSRIVSVAWSLSKQFSKLIMSDKIHYYIRQPEGFTDIPSSHIHGITFNMAVTDGIMFNDIFEDKGLYDDLLACEYIIAHNVYFDIHILLNELYRLNTEKAKKTIVHIQSLITLKRCICTGNINKDICKLEFNNSKYTKSNKKQKIYKMPKLSELYKYYYGTEMENAHNAEGDVIAVKKCILKMIETHNVDI